MANSSGGDEHVRRWEPMDGRGLPRLRLLSEAATRVQGDALTRLETISGADLGELVVWAWVFDPDRTHVSMVDHHLFDLWVHPGGRAEPGEDPLDAAARELLEETGTTGVPVAISLARWWPVAEPPQRRREHLWDRMVEHLALDGLPAGGR